MRFTLGRLVLVKRYLWGSLAIAILPLLLISVLYDRHSANLRDRLFVERIEGDLQTTVVKINRFIRSQNKRLDSLADLPEIASLFTNQSEFLLSSRLLDFLYLVTGDPDIYGINFYDEEGNFIHSFPAWIESSSDFEKSLIPGRGNKDNHIEYDLPSDGQPGWLLLKKPVLREGKIIGFIALRVRLASMTEETAPLFLRGIYEPLIITPNKEALSVVGTVVEPRILLAKSEEFLPGWHITLQHSGELIEEPDIGRWLLALVAISAMGITWLFVSMSQRLARMITPLNNGAQAIASGDLATRVSENIPGELGALARSFNHMSEQLSAMIKSRVYVDRQASLGKLAAGIAHEIRNPLATIRTIVHGLIRQEKNPDHREMLEVVNNEVIRTDVMVEEFMNYARPRIPHKEEVVVSDVLHSVSVLTSATALEAKVNVNMIGDTSLIAYVDSGQLSQILMNIILNALQAMEDGGHLTIRVHRSDDKVHITVVDTGHGIPADQIQEIQAPFYTTKKSGTGLGLAICAQLIHVNDGTLDIESTVGEGTTVHMTFPLALRGNHNDESE